METEEHKQGALLILKTFAFISLLLTFTFRLSLRIFHTGILNAIPSGSCDP